MDYIKELRAELAKKDEEIARLKEWKAIVEGTGTEQEAVIRMAADDYLKPVVECWRGKVEKLQADLDRVSEAMEIFKVASYQGHAAHWDLTMQHGAGCHECIRVRELREEAETILRPWRARQGKETG